MDELCRELLFLDMEAKFIDSVPYDTDDPDLYYGGYSEDESSFSQQPASVSSSTKDAKNNYTNDDESEKNRICKLGKRQGKGRTVNILSNSAASSQSEEYPIINQLIKSQSFEALDNLSNDDNLLKASQSSRFDCRSYGSASLHRSDSDSDAEMVRKHRSISFNSSKKGNKSSHGTPRSSTVTSNKSSKNYVNSVHSSKAKDVKSSSLSSLLLNSSLPSYSTTHSSKHTMMFSPLPPSPTLSYFPTPPTPNTWKRKSLDDSRTSISSLSQDEQFTPPSSNKRLKSYKNRSNIDYVNNAMPTYRFHQFLGDSQLLRFSEQLLFFRRHVTEIEGSKTTRLGYCVSGQRIADLEQRLSKNECKLDDKVIILIGTNDMNYRTELDAMCKSYDNILNMLKPKTKRIVLLTVPPLPKLTNDVNHWRILRQFNNYIKNYADSKQIFVVDLASVYVSYGNSTSTEYFERVLQTKAGPKPDLIHLNESGFKMLRAVLDIQYFDKVPQDE